MRKHAVRVLDLPSNSTCAALIILSVLFLIGGLAGCSLINQTDGIGEAAVGEYIEGYLSSTLSGDVSMPAFLFLVWKTVRWPLFLVVLGLTPIGLVGIPVLFLIRAFLLSFSIAAFFHILGTQGLILGFVLFGLSGAIQIPVFFVLGIQCFLNSCSIVSQLVGDSKRSLTFDKVQLIRYLICFAAVIICCVIEFYAVPTVLNSLADVLQS